MIPFGLTAAQFSKKYTQLISRESNKSIQKLNLLFSQPFDSDILSARVEIFLGEMGNETPSIWVYYHGENNKVSDNEDTIYAGRALDLSVFEQAIMGFDVRYFSDKKFDGTNLIANLVKQWFSECWWKAGGWAYPIACDLRVHDDFGDGDIINLTAANKPTK